MDVDLLREPLKNGKRIRRVVLILFVIHVDSFQTITGVKNQG